MGPGRPIWDPDPAWGEPPARVGSPERLAWHRFCEARDYARLRQEPGDHQDQAAGIEGWRAERAIWLRRYPVPELDPERLARGLDLEARRGDR